MKNACGVPEYGNNNEQEEEYMRETEAAAYIRVSTSTLRMWRRKGRINKQGTLPPKAYGHGRQIWYKRRDLDAWIVSGLIKHFWFPSSGCVHRSFEQGLDEILNGKITDDVLAGALEAELNSCQYNDGETDGETYVYMSPDELKALLDSGDSYKIPS